MKKMGKKTKFIVAGVAVVIIGAIVYTIYKRKKDKSEPLAKVSKAGMKKAVRSKLLSNPNLQAKIAEKRMQGQ